MLLSTKWRKIRFIFGHLSVFPFTLNRYTNQFRYDCRLFIRMPINRYIYLEPGAHVINQSHIFQIILIFCICNIGLALQIEFFNQKVVGFLSVMNQYRSRSNVILKCFIDSCTPMAYHAHRLPHMYSCAHQ